MSFYDKLRSQKFLSFTLVLFTLCLGILLGTLVSTGVKAARDQAVAPGATPLQIPSPVQLQNSFSSLAKMLEPSVVNISTEYIPKTNLQTRNRRRVVPQQPQDEDQDGSSMQEFFQRFFGGPNGPQLGPEEGQRGASLGSGFVVDRAGYILTNNHVVEKATRIRVKFNNDPEEYDAKVIGTDVQTDLAVIKVDRPNLVPVRIGNSDAIQVGDWAVAIGSPFGFQATVTAGIISAKSRDIPGDSTQFQHFLQTDAAINPGNSGGPLLNINGEVIGINTMIASRSGGYQGIGFAMPINTAAKVYNQIIRTGHVTRGSIGVSFRPSEVARDLLRAYGAKQGVFVQAVEPNGPADKAGLRAEDIITSINGKTITNGEELVELVADSPVGTNLSVNYLRDHKPQHTNIVVGDRSKIFPKELARNGAVPDEGGEPGDTATQARFGLGIRNLTQPLRDNLGFKEHGGVLVESVEPGSFAEDIGFAPKDVIVAANQQPVTSTEDFQRIQKSLKAGDAVAFRVYRNLGTGRAGSGWQSLFLAGTMPAQ